MLLANRRNNRPSILIVDEAQALPLELLEEIRLLLNIETPSEKLLQIILAGQPELTEVLHRPELRQFRQRISCLCKLHPLTIHELREYLQHRLSHAGANQQDLFPEPTIELIYNYTGGIPRLVNSLCDAALQTGFGLQSRRITPSIVDEAAADLDLEDSSVLEESLMLDKGGDEREEPAIPEVRVPLESYKSRQGSLAFLTSLVDRWK